MRVAICTDAVGRGGAEQSVRNLLHALPDSVEAHLVGVHAPLLAGLTAARTQVHVVDGHWLPVLARIRPDVVHVNRHSPWAAQRATAAALALPGARVVVVDQLPLRSAHLPTVLRTRALTVRVDAPVAVGAASARRVEDFYALGRHSVRSVVNGVPDSPERRRPAQPGPLQVVATGRLDRVKAHDVLLRAVAQLDDVEVTVLGEGRGRPALEALVEELGLTGRVRLPGHTDSPRTALASADAFAMPSRTEGYPLALVEAMLAALPCVATPVGAVPEALGGHGLLVPVDDVDALAGALARLRDDPDLRARLGDGAREHALATATDHRMAGTYVALWQQLVDGPRAPRLRVPRPRS